MSMCVSADENYASTREGTVLKGSQTVRKSRDFSRLPQLPTIYRKHPLRRFDPLLELFFGYIEVAWLTSAPVLHLCERRTKLKHRKDASRQYAPTDPDQFLVSSAIHTPLIPRTCARQRLQDHSQTTQGIENWG